MSITGWPDTPPTRVGMSLGDITASLYTAIGILAAIHHRTVTGQGQKVDIAMLDCQVSILENAITRYQVENKSPVPLGNRHPTITPFQAYQASDSYFVIAAGNDSLWIKLCEVIGRPDLANHPDYATNNLRTRHIAELNAELDKILRNKTAAEWIRIIDEAGIPCGPINTIDKVMADQQVLSRNMIVEVDDTRAGKIKIAGNPIKMTSIEEKTHRGPAPEIGGNNLEIYSGLLGLSPEEIDLLKVNGVI